MTDLKKFAATVQALLTLLLIGAVAVVVLALLALIGFLQIKKLPVDQSMTALLNTGYNALINMGAIGVGFWLARHRTKDSEDADDPKAPTANPIQPAQPAKPNA